MVIKSYERVGLYSLHANNRKGDFLVVHSLKLPSIDASLGKAHAALLAERVIVSTNCSSLIIESDSLVIVLAIKDPYFFCDWNIELVIGDIQHQLLFITCFSFLSFVRFRSDTDFYL